MASRGARSSWKKGSVFLAITGLAVIVYLGFTGKTSIHSKEGHTSIYINNKSFNVETVCSGAARAQGLSGRAVLPSGEGMLFVFEQPAPYGFWMKEMNFAIDIIWIDAHQTVVHIERELSPSTFPQAFAPPLPAKYVLELAAGEGRGIAVGDKFRLEHVLPPKVPCR